jgi:23S rRNA (guanosine2251-2'-O)-methyltransferase
LRTLPPGLGGAAVPGRPRKRPGERVPEARVLAGRRPVLELLQAGRGAERVLIARELAPAPVLGEIRRRAEESSIPVRVVPRAEIERLATGINHQGVVALTARFRYTPLEELVEAPDATILFLDGVTDPHNLGSLLRSADGAGFSGVVVPARRSAGVTPTVRHVSAGASEVVPVARVANLAAALDRARTSGLWILGLDAAAEQDLWRTNLAEPPVGLVLGAEDRGISPHVREHCDGFACIPTSGRLGSLNVAVAGAVAMFEIARRRSESATL